MSGFKVTERQLFEVGNILVYQEFDGMGNHRLVWESSVGDVATYIGISTLCVNEEQYCGTSEFYGESLPRVFKVTSGVLVT